MLSIAPFEAAYQMYSPAPPMVAAADESSTTAPPGPPRLFAACLIRLRTQISGPMAFTSKTSRKVPVATASNREGLPVIPQL